MKRSIMLAMLLPLLLGGCATFRKIFSQEDPALDRTPKQQLRSSRRSGSASEDPLFDAIFAKGNAEKKHGISSDLLSNEEKRILQGVSSAPKASDDPDVQMLRSRGKEARDKHADWVFGTKNGSYFGN